MSYDPSNAILTLSKHPQDEGAWYELWDTLHHQGDIFEFSYTAIVQLTDLQKENRDLGWNFYALASIIEIERHRKTNPMLPDLCKLNYKQAWVSIIEMAIQDLSLSETENDIRALLSAIAIGKKFMRLGVFITNFSEEEIEDFLEEQLGWKELYH